MIPKLTDVLSDETKWTQGVLSRNNEGFDVTPHADDACRWCVIGAALRVSGDSQLTYLRVFNALQKVVISYYGGSSVPDFNDAPGRTFAEVYAVAKRADEILAQGATP